MLVTNCSLFNPTPSLAGAMPLEERGAVVVPLFAGDSAAWTGRGPWGALETGASRRRMPIPRNQCLTLPHTPAPKPPTHPPPAMVINRFGMRSDIDSYNLAGMGCSAGVLAIGLANKLLRVR